ncbi:unnamed protein product [Colias eurytheme]|nr:unnamed protein product [Colias eurytheme]
MANLSNEEYADMMLAYGKADCNSHEAQRIYQERYPNRRLPHYETFSTTYRRLRETGNLNLQEPRVNVRQHNVEVDDRILQAFDDDPTTSIRVVADGLNVSVWKVWSVLRADGRHAFHYTPVQGLEEGDNARRLEFCRFLLHTDVEDSDFLKRILWTDESNFSHEGI